MKRLIALLIGAHSVISLADEVQHEKYLSIYFLGFVKHVHPLGPVHQGNMDSFGLSKELHYKKFQFDTGVNTYVDSYWKRSYAIFSNVSYEDYQFTFLTPMIQLMCTNKGEFSTSGERHTYCGPIPKLRFGRQSGLFADLSAVPHFGTVTNGWVALELGYKW